MSHSATAGRPKGETAKAITSPCMPQRSPVNKANRAPIRQRKDRAQNTHDAKEKFQDLKDEAADLCYDAKAQAGLDEEETTK